MKNVAGQSFSNHYHKSTSITPTPTTHEMISFPVIVPLIVIYLLTETIRGKDEQLRGTKGEQLGERTNN